MLTTYRGRQYNTARSAEARKLAAQLGIAERVANLHASGAAQFQIDRALWEAILARVGNGVLAGGCPVSAEIGDRCPEASEGLPCQKRHLPGRDYHGGGHWFMSDEQWALMRQGHYSARSLLSGEVTTLYTAETCPGPPECFHESHEVRRG